MGTMRQALDSPQISTDDHLKFQGLDASAGAQLMEVLGSELDHKLPLDWPKNYGTVAALAAQMSTHVQELQPEKRKTEPPPKEPKAKAKSKEKAKAQPKEKVAASPTSPEPKSKRKSKKAAKDEKAATAASAFAGTGGKLATLPPPVSQDPPEAGILSHFNRAASLRVVQQVGYFMRDQDRIIQAVLARADDNPAT